MYATKQAGASTQC